MKPINNKFTSLYRTLYITVFTVVKSTPASAQPLVETIQSTTLKKNSFECHLLLYNLAV